MGASIVHFLIEDNNVDTVYVVDPNESVLLSTMKKFSLHASANKIQYLCVSADSYNIVQLTTQVDMIIAAIPWKATFELIKRTREQDLPLVSITRPADNDLEALYQMVNPNSSSIIVGCGLEPGLTEIFANHFVSLYPNVVKLNIYCGGITTAPNPPLFYKQVFGSDLPIADRAVYQYKAGQLIKVERFSEVEEILIENVGKLEAWHDGMSSWLLNNLKNDTSILMHVNQKTLRWAGFTDTLFLLKRLGFFQKEQIMINNQKIVPYQLTQRLLKNYASFDHVVDRDMVILLLKGYFKDEDTRSITFYGYFNNHDNLSAMAIVTGYTAVATAKILLEKKLKGFIHPEQIFKNEVFLNFVKNLCYNGAKIDYSMEICI
jgi:lysine 6-dehydrogenase